MPGALNLVAALALLALIVSLALKAAQLSPPAIAEFAPQAQQIREAPQEQTAELGNGPGGAASGAQAPRPSPSAAGATGNAVFLRCVGDPPRQIEDPQSPPCVPSWSGQNGGRLGQGVNSSEIRIAVPEYSASPVADFENFFNKRFEFYGRRVRFIDASGNGNGSPDPATQRATAQANASMDIFGSNDYEFAGGLAYHKELASLGVVSTEEGWNFDQAALQQYAPYIWAYVMEPERGFADLGSWACNRLAGGKAVHAGPLLSGKPRVFGAILLEEEANENLTTKPLADELAACGSSLAATYTVVCNDNACPTDLGSWEAIITQLQKAGVTSVFCVCHGAVLGADVESAATSENYYPEWLVDGYALEDAPWVMQGFGRSDQMAHVFGISHLPKWVDKSDTPAMWAAKEVDPGYAGPSVTSAFGWFYFNLEYRDFLLLASGIQMAGPHLTPQTFAAALHRTVFPNPSTKLFAGHVGFAGAIDTMTDDGAEIYWSVDALDPVTDRSGTYCYVDHGARHTSGDWPKGGDPFFAIGSCDNGQPPLQGSG